MSKNFSIVIAGYLNKIYKYIEKLSQEEFVEIGARIEEFKDKVSAFRKKYILESMSYLLFQHIPTFNEQFKANQVTPFYIYILILQRQK